MIETLVKVHFRKVVIGTLLIPLAASSQSTLSTSKRVLRYGTCATTVLAPFGAAFVIDSRITEKDQSGNITSQFEGCKVRLPKPTILIAGVGWEDVSFGDEHWNSLVEGEKAAKQLSDLPTEEELNSWSYRWSRTLLRHFEHSPPPSRPGKISEMLLITKVDGQPYYRRTTVEWDGKQFHAYVEGQQIERTRPYLAYSGLCRDFVVHSSDEGGFLISAKYRNQEEQAEMRGIGDRLKISGKSVVDLSVAALRLEDVLTQIDLRLEGSVAEIAPPFATAEWSETGTGWTAHFNPACHVDQKSIK